MICSSLRLVKQAFFFLLIGTALITVLPIIVSKTCSNNCLPLGKRLQRLVYYDQATSFGENLILASTTKASPQEKCPAQPPNLLGPINVTFYSPTFDEVARRNPDLLKGGEFRPVDCISTKERLAIVIPYRDREYQLRALLHHLHPILQRQQLDYTIFVVEQADNKTFNKALLMNAAFMESQKMGAANNNSHQFECYIFHDVDLFVEDDRALYKCSDIPFHLSEFIDKYGYESFNVNNILFGGVVSLPGETFESVNGYSNFFFGWGGEDDDMRLRLLYHTPSIPIDVPDDNKIYRFKMLRHQQDVGNPSNEHRFGLIQYVQQRMKTDGLSSVRYNLVSTQLLPTHTRLLIEFDHEEIKRLNIWWR